MSSDPNWDDRSTSSSGARRANLFSKWRHRSERGGLGVGGVDGGVNKDRPHHRHVTAATTTDPISKSRHGAVGVEPIAESPPSAGSASGGSPYGKRASVPPTSLAVSASARAAAAADNNGSSENVNRNPSSRSHRHRSRSRPRDRDKEKGAGGGGEGGGEQPSPSHRAKSRSSSHRSKSRTRARSRPRERSGKSSGGTVENNNDGGYQQQLQGGSISAAQEAARQESLRDYWKRRAEESKERVGGGGASSASTANNSSTNSSGTRVEKLEGDDGNRAGSGRPAPPPPPRGEGTSARRQQRPKSRGRADRSVGDSSSVTPTSTPRKVDSIASALVGHARRTPSSTIHRSRPQSGSIGASGDSRDAPTSTQLPVEDLSSLSPLHHSLATASWPTLISHLRALSGGDGKTATNSEIAAQLSLPHPRLGGTVLHVAAWKAPPALAVMMIRSMPREAREMSVLLGIRDGEGNTPLHLCCGNLDCGSEEEEKNGGSDMKHGEGEGIDCLAALRAIIQSLPSRAWAVQNSEGDTPLHMLVSSPLCTSDSTSLLSSVSSQNFNAKKAKLAAEAMQLALSTPDASEACLTQDGTGATPLHVALAAGAHDGVVESLLAANPVAARTGDWRDMLPLHWAAAFGNRAGHGAVRRLVAEYPRALTAPTADGDIPLHLAVSNAMMVEEDGQGGRSGGRGSTSGADGGDPSSFKVDKNRLKIVELLMHDHHSGRRGSSSGDDDQASPILTTNREKLTPLHCCALFDAPPQISKLLMKHPDANAASSMTNSFGATPLHLAAAQPGVSQSIATVLAIGTPDAASVQDRLKRTPLHVAAQNTYATNLLIKTLAELNPAAAAVKTQRGHLPLHLAAQSQAKDAVIRALIKAYPAAAEARNKSNNTPLHDAAKYRASLGVVRLLLDAHPGALYVQNQYGNLPLHCATAYQAPSEVVQLLLKSWPEGASMQNRNQDAPLHYAAAYATSASSVRPLIDAAPAAVLLLNGSGQSPVDRAKANNAPADIVKLLEGAAEEYSKNAETGDGSWASFGQGREQQQSAGGGGGGSSAHASF